MEEETDSGTPAPDRVGNYRIVRLLGRGGMGVVYEAEHAWTGRRVALKLLDASRAPSHERVARFMQEARTATRAEHPGIVEVLDLGREGDALYLVQELLDGEDLGARLARVGRLGPREAVLLACATLEALAHAHARSVVHRDLKPSNIFLARRPDGSEAPTLIDFGVSKVLDDDRVGAETRTGQVLGTPGYMSPEQLRGDRELDARADVWSMGVVLYQMLAGRLPWRSSNYNLMVFEVLSGRREPLSRTAPDVPEALATLVERALAAEPDDRFAGAQELLDALRAWARTSTDAAPGAPRGAVALPSSETPTATGERPPVERPRRRSFVALAGAGLGLALAVNALTSPRAPTVDAPTPTWTAARPAAPPPRGSPHAPFAAPTPTADAARATPVPTPRPPHVRATPRPFAPVAPTRARPVAPTDPPRPSRVLTPGGSY